MCNARGNGDYVLKRRLFKTIQVSFSPLLIHSLAILLKQGNATKKWFSQKNHMMEMKVNQIIASIITQQYEGNQFFLTHCPLLKGCCQSQPHLRLQLRSHGQNIKEKRKKKSHPKQHDIQNLIKSQSRKCTSEKLLKKHTLLSMQYLE